MNFLSNYTLKVKYPMNNKLTLWYDIEKSETVKEEVKSNIKQRYSFSDGEFVSIGGGFK